MSVCKPAVGMLLRRNFSVKAKAGLEAIASKPPVRVAITGAAGQIGYSLVMRVASGEMLGKDQPIDLHLLEIPQGLKALDGVVMELEDCAFPLVNKIVPTDDAAKAFEGIDYGLLVGARPRGPGMERKDLMQANAKIFVSQGKALNSWANKSVKVVVVGNPANTNALIASHNAPSIPRGNFTAMTRLDHNRATAQLAKQTQATVNDVEKLCIWGNHSSTQYPDIQFATVKGKAAVSLVQNEWYKSTFIPTVQQRGAAIIAARGASSAASAANACIEHIRDWVLGSDGKWVSMAIPSDSTYGFSDGIITSYPVVCANGKYEVVRGLELSEFGKEMIARTNKELLEERAMVAENL
eukprot:CAMPEP_0196652764 /NCGR_PEP_ID=MMETSP1086-20130531/2174_1 /TAXON_ID=77921 /ORGANISM="Cyanoptyche  gloeocystis , Strain SAG4.97" /LENGTH=352 /DNA_ID=CAMNT_0041983521 /DNA_START=75 /DNA_END=1133 /DNA_ORIENTATION=-